MAKSRPPTWSGYWLPMKQKSRPSSMRNCLSCSTSPCCKSASEWFGWKVEELDEIAVLEDLGGLGVQFCHRW